MQYNSTHKIAKMFPCQSVYKVIGAIGATITRLLSKHHTYITRFGNLCSVPYWEIGKTSALAYWGKGFSSEFTVFVFNPSSTLFMLKQDGLAYAAKITHFQSHTEIVWWCCASEYS
jgi:hypothetical protein